MADEAQVKSAQEVLIDRLGAKLGQLAVENEWYLLQIESLQNHVAAQELNMLGMKKREEEQDNQFQALSEERNALAERLKVYEPPAVDTTPTPRRAPKPPKESN